MITPFGFPIPDEVAAAFMAAAIREKQEQQRKGGKSSDLSGMKPDPQDVEKRAKKSAETAKKFYDAYRAAGFNEPQAFELTKGNLNTKI